MALLHIHNDVIPRCKQQGVTDGNCAMLVAEPIFSGTPRRPIAGTVFTPVFERKIVSMPKRSMPMYDRATSFFKYQVSGVARMANHHAREIDSLFAKISAGQTHAGRQHGCALR